LIEPPLPFGLSGFNVPETVRGKYACEAEHDLGVRARSQLRELVKAGDLDFDPLSNQLVLG
jgi:hypothetical protein